MSRQRPTRRTARLHRRSLPPSQPPLSPRQMHYSILSFVELTSLCLSLTAAVLRGLMLSYIFHVCFCVAGTSPPSRAWTTAAHAWRTCTYAEENVRNCLRFFMNVADHLVHLPRDDEARP